MVFVFYYTYFGYVFNGKRMVEIIMASNKMVGFLVEFMGCMENLLNKKKNSYFMLSLCYLFQ